MARRTDPPTARLRRSAQTPGLRESSEPPQPRGDAPLVLALARRAACTRRCRVVAVLTQETLLQGGPGCVVMNRTELGELALECPVPVPEVATPEDVQVGVRDDGLAE
jgi:hypothetical protein